MNDEQNRVFEDALVEAMAEAGLAPLSEVQLQRLVKHYEVMCQWNRRTNITRIVDPADAARFHYAESMLGASLIKGARTVLDVGSGAGFPAVPIAVARPDLEVTALEINQKKSLFLTEIGDRIALTNLRVVRDRFEEFDWSGFDLLASRALDRAEEIWPLALTRLGRGQKLLLYSSHDLIQKLRQQSGQDYEIEAYQIPNTEARYIALFRRR